MMVFISRVICHGYSQIVLLPLRCLYRVVSILRVICPSSVALPCMSAARVYVFVCPCRPMSSVTPPVTLAFPLHVPHLPFVSGRRLLLSAFIRIPGLFSLAPRWHFHFNQLCTTELFPPPHSFLRQILSRNYPIHPSPSIGHFKNVVYNAIKGNW